VVTDRYFWSSVAYGISDIGEINDIYFVAFSMLSFYNQFIVPDLTVFLKINPETSMERIDELGKKKEIYENSQKLLKIKKGYEFLIEKFPEEFRIVSSDRPVEEVHREILKKISFL
jgi:dTMP kinase